MPCLRAAILLCVKKHLWSLLEKSWLLLLYLILNGSKAVIYVFFFRFENAISNTLYHTILFYLMMFTSKIQESDNTHIHTAANKICCSISDCLYCLMTDEKFALCAAEF